MRGGVCLQLQLQKLRERLQSLRRFARRSCKVRLLPSHYRQLPLHLLHMHRDPSRHGNAAAHTTKPLPLPALALFRY